MHASQIANDMAPSETRATALDFATHSAFDGESVRNHVACASSEENHAEEIRATITELCESFGASKVHAIFFTMPDVAPQQNQVGEERLLQAIRGYSALILDSKYPKFVAQLVGKIAKMEMATGKRIDLRQLGATIGVSKQAASKQMASIALRLGLPRPDSTEENRQAHALCNRRNYGAGKTA